MAAYERHQIGKSAENQACQFLTTKGLQLIQANYRSYFGEIDLIMQDKRDIVFVEVRSKRRIDHGTAIESITHSKQRKLIKTALHFLQQRRWLDMACRFDVVGIHWIDGQMQLDWIKNAFSAE